MENVTQADRGIAARFTFAIAARTRGERAAILIGSADDDCYVQAFADHRRQSQEPLMEVLRETRDALYEQVDECFDESCEMCARHERVIQRADTILSGEVDRG